jgi:hypothetical protein
MNPNDVSKIAAARSIHPVWQEVGGTFFRQGFLQGYYWARDELKMKAPLYFGAGFLAGLLLMAVL